MQETFGWGEICTRDFEALLNGAVLLKPDMSHIDTFPNVYTDESYLSIDWDFSNFEELIKKCLEDRSFYLKIASNGQSILKNMISDEGKKSFVKHFLNVINK
jgi:hypothetical protein